MMVSLDILEVGHRMILQAIKGLPASDWDTAGVDGDWSVKDVIAHLTSYEYLLVDMLDTVGNNAPAPTLTRWLRDRERFNTDEVTRRREKTAREVMAEYVEVHAETIDRLLWIPAEALRKEGTLPWFDEAQSLEDFITGSFFRHKRMHGLQIASFRDHLIHRDIA